MASSAHRRSKRISLRGLGANGESITKLPILEDVDNLFPTVKEPCKSPSPPPLNELALQQNPDLAMDESEKSFLAALRPLASFGTRAVGAGESEASSDWNILLSEHRSASCQKRAHVANCLANMLDQDISYTEQVVDNSNMEDPQVLQTCSSRKAALLRAQEFRDNGVSVRIVADTQKKNRTFTQNAKYIGGQFAKLLTRGADSESGTIAKLAKRLQQGRAPPKSVEFCHCPASLDPLSARSTGSQERRNSRECAPGMLPIDSVGNTASSFSIISGASSSSAPPPATVALVAKAPPLPINGRQGGFRRKIVTGEAPEPPTGSSPLASASPLSAPNTPRSTSNRSRRRSGKNINKRLYMSEPGLAGFGFENSNVPHFESENSADSQEKTPSAPSAIWAENRLKRLLSRHKEEVQALSIMPSDASKLSGTSLKVACKLARTFIYGGVCERELTKPMEIDYALRMGLKEAIGSRSMVEALHVSWMQLDPDISNSVTQDEYQDYYRAKFADSKVFSQEDAACLAKLLFGNRTYFTVESLMRLIWPSAGANETATMKEWLGEMDELANRTYVKPPPVLDPHELEGLMAVFETVDIDGSGTVSFEELMHYGVMYKEQFEEYVRICGGKTTTAELSKWEFCEMMCPAGFRVYEDSRTCRQADGQLIHMDDATGRWFVCSS
eukprot:TRINITY_DN13284_c0_g1_i1.p1 TRINITY_DN13284_c0_g1~~TRINITY_DN13284_c0_g1_i1.p1  ORF type:complete len:673 (+),score=107.18 TRINITY_DN13284_c0_g1_i1:55-2073(+)